MKYERGRNWLGRRYDEPLRQILEKTQWYWDHDGVPPACKRGVSKSASMPYSRTWRGGVCVRERRIDCLSHLKVPHLPELRVLGHKKMDTRACSSPAARALCGDYIQHAGCALASVQPKSSPGRCSPGFSCKRN
jgi:hypothetical protein